MAFRCYHHPDREAAGTCCYCDRALCGECLATNKEGKVFCRREEECLDYQDGLLSAGEAVSPIVALLVDERTLDAQMKRLADILDELGELEGVLADLEADGESGGVSPAMAEGPPPFERDPRIPGFCACKLAEEAAALLNLISFRADFLCAESALSGGDALQERAREVQAFLEREAAPKIRGHLDRAGPYVGGDGAELLASLERRNRQNEP